MNFMLFGDEKPSKVSFGSTGDREIFPSHVPHSRFGNELNPITGAPHRGPGHYEVEQTTNMINEMDRRPVSKKGYTLGARTAPRFNQYADMITPDPTKYQPDMTKPRQFRCTHKPFNSGTQRNQNLQDAAEHSAPGPGMYECKPVLCRQVSYHQSFGSRPINLPDVAQHSTIDCNTDKLRSTKDEKLYHRRLAYLRLFYD
jgi:hypothetical protein